MHSTDVPRKTAVIAAVQLADVSDADHAGNIAELGRLTKTLGYDVVGAVSQRRGGLRSAAVLGPGKLKELAAYTGGTGVVPNSAPLAGKSKAKARLEEEEEEEAEVEETPDDADSDGQTEDLAVMGAPPHPDGAYPHADVVVVDHEISLRQARNLEGATDAEVLDRTGVIVEIFHRHANTREARLQVEIARLAYVVPRLRAGVKGADRQQGGIGGRGAGETALELDRRRVRDRVSELKAELASIARDDDNRRSRRKGVRRVGLVGYTNAGKSSLMRALTGSEVLVEDKLFATLGTTVRALAPEVLPRILVSDTVGFIKKLPHDLVASFRSTLDEALEASLLLFVVDSSDPAFRSQLAVTRTVLGEIGAYAADSAPPPTASDEGSDPAQSPSAPSREVYTTVKEREAPVFNPAPSLLLLNKTDQVSEAERAALAVEFPDAIQLSAHDPADIVRLRDTIIAFFDSEYEDTVILVPYTRGHVVGEIRRTMNVLSETHEEDGTHLRVKAPPVDVARIRALLA